MNVFPLGSPPSSDRLVLTGLAFLGLLAVGAWLAFSGGESAPTPTDLTKFNELAARGVAEDPNARLNYERQRLKNPETGQIPDNIRKKELAFAKNIPVRLRKASSWQARGPTNVGGRSRALGVDVSDGSTILAGGASGGMWRTTDGGSSWTRTFDPDQRPDVTALAQDTRSGRKDVWYAGTGEFLNNSARGGGGAIYFGDGIYRSTDGGQSWTRLSSTSGEETVFDKLFDFTYAVEVDPSAPTDGTAGDDSEVYAATYGRIFRTTDGGANWTGVLTSNTNGNYASRTDVEVTSTGDVYGVLSSDGDRNGIFYSTTGDPISNDPSNWTDITPSDWPSTFERTVLAVNPSNEDEIWVLTEANGSGPNGHELWKYDQSTDTWTDSTNYLPDRSEGLTGTFNSNKGYDLIVEVHPDNGDLLYVGGRNLWRIDVSASASDANTWIGGYTHDPNNPESAWYNPSTSDRHHPDQHALAFEPGNGDVMYVGSDGGIHRTDNNRAGSTGEAGDGAVDWVDLNNGYFTTQFYAVCQFRSPDDGSETTYIAGGMQDNGTWGSSSGSVTDPWTQLNSGDGGYCSLTNNATDNGTSQYVSAQNGKVYRRGYDSSDNLQSFDRVDPSSASGQQFINPFALDPSDADVMYYPAGSNLWRKTDLETNPDRSAGWEEMTGAAVSNHAITALDVSSSNAENVLYYGTVYTGSNDPGDRGKVFRLDNANTTSTGTSPTEVTDTQNFPEGGYVSSIAVDPTDSDKVMVVFSNYDVTSIFYSSDGGDSWTDVEDNLGGTYGPSIRSAAILPQPGLDQTTYYVGTSVGLYSTTALNGSSPIWSQSSDMESVIGDVVVDQVQARADDGRVLVGTHANGTFSTTKPIPVEMADFDATVQGESVQLSWTTASETNNAGFEVEHKDRSGEFEQLGFVEGEGTTSEQQTYQYRVNRSLNPGPHTFRLEQVDLDGTTSYSDTRTITISPSGSYSLTGAAPNPFRQTTAMQLTVSESQPVRVAVYNTIGQRVRTILDRKVSANQPVDLQLNAQTLASGLYLVRVKGESFEATRKVTLVE